ncbi:MAG: c-type cytochrome, partial [Bacteroidales bacterium]|nr:c-type cytochrome [Bacteroidales bacterium]
QKIAAGLADNGIKTESQKQIIAVIAYLQRLGRDITEIPGNEATPDVETTPAPRILPMPLPDDQAVLAEADALYKKNCVACHGMLGEGNVIGPNLTDAYWIKGGSPEDIYHVIAEGVPAKGMQSWKNQLTEEQMVALTAYVLNMQGTNPPNAKEPQGELENGQTVMR